MIGSVGKLWCCWRGWQCCCSHCWNCTPPRHCEMPMASTNAALRSPIDAVIAQEIDACIRLRLLFDWLNLCVKLSPRTFHHLVNCIALLCYSVVQFVESVSHRTHRSLERNKFFLHLARKGFKTGPDHIIPVCIVCHTAAFLNPDWLLPA